MCQGLAYGYGNSHFRKPEKRIDKRRRSTQNRPRTLTGLCTRPAHLSPDRSAHHLLRVDLNPVRLLSGERENPPMASSICPPPRCTPLHHRCLISAVRCSAVTGNQPTAKLLFSSFGAQRLRIRLLIHPFSDVQHFCQILRAWLWLKPVVKYLASIKYPSSCSYI